MENGPEPSGACSIVDLIRIMGNAGDAFSLCSGYCDIAFTEEHLPDVIDSLDDFAFVGRQISPLEEIAKEAASLSIQLKARNDDYLCDSDRNSRWRGIALYLGELVVSVGDVSSCLGVESEIQSAKAKLHEPLNSKESLCVAAAKLFDDGGMSYAEVADELNSKHRKLILAICSKKKANDKSYPNKGSVRPWVNQGRELRQKMPWV